MSYRGAKSKGSMDLKEEKLSRGRTDECTDSTGSPPLGRGEAAILAKGYGGRGSPRKARSGHPETKSRVKPGRGTGASVTAPKEREKTSTILAARGGNKLDISRRRNPDNKRDPTKKTASCGSHRHGGKEAHG